MKTEFVRPAVPASARKACAGPVAIPDRDISAEETTNLWGRDRTSLRTCEIRRAAAVSAIDGETP